jgi:ATP-dependent Clp protease ATP-binding subunit ClpC
MMNEKLSDTLIDTTHILLAILNTKSPLTTLLNKAGVTYTRYKKYEKNEKIFQKNSAYSDDEKPAGELPKGSSINKSEGSIKAKTPVLDNFCRDISKAVENGEVDKVIGREKEIKNIPNTFT